MDLKTENGNRLPGSKVTDDQLSGKILLCAPSNAAVYVLVRRLIAEMKSWTAKNGRVKSRSKVSKVVSFSLQKGVDLSYWTAIFNYILGS